jgi:ATPase family associated with various cellular activities (AAA)
VIPTKGEPSIPSRWQELAGLQEETSPTNDWPSPKPTERTELPFNDAPLPHIMDPGGFLQLETDSPAETEVQPVYTESSSDSTSALPSDEPATSAMSSPVRQNPLPMGSPSARSPVRHNPRPLCDWRPTKRLITTMQAMASDGPLEPASELISLQAMFHDEASTMWDHPIIAYAASSDPDTLYYHDYHEAILNRKYDDAMVEAIFEADGSNATVAATLREMSDSKDVKTDGKGFGGKEVGPSMWSKPIKDQLNLTGLLNVLDGVVDTPGRILIMTTNHPEMLDPAIIRPGRIDKKILLGYMCAIDVIGMLEHYFQQSLTSEQKTRMEDLISGGFNLTPAQVEQMTAEYEEVEDMIRALESRSQFRATRRTSSLRSLPLDLDARL